MSLLPPTVPEPPGGLTVVVASPVCMSKVGMIGLPCLSFANAGRPAAEHGSAFDVIGVKLRSFGVLGAAFALAPNDNAVKAAAPTAPVIRARVDRRFDWCVIELLRCQGGR